MSNHQPQQPNNSYHSHFTGETREAFVITIHDGSNIASSPIPSLQIISLSSFNTATTLHSSDANQSHQYLTKTILGFTLCTAMALLPLLNNMAGLTHVARPLERFIFFLLLAFATSLASISSHREQGKTIAVVRCIAVLSIALAYASVASVFLRTWLQVAAYALCMVPLYAFVHVRLFSQLEKARIWCSKSSNFRDADLEDSNDESPQH